MPLAVCGTTVHCMPLAVCGTTGSVLHSTIVLAGKLLLALKFAKLLVAATSTI